MKYLLIISLALLSVKTRAQLPVPTIVSDPTTHARMATVIARSAEEVEETRKIITQLKEAADLIKKVSSSLRQIELLERIIYNQKVAFERAGDAMQRAKDSGQFTSAELNMITYNFTILLSATNRTLSLAQSILEDGFFKMTDAERLEFLLEMEREINAKRYDIVRLYEDYERLAQKRKMLEVFSN